jgi:hypothetical protein
VNIGYRFIQTQAGAANGQFSGIGADESQVCVKVEAIQPMGLLISNGQFVCMHGDTAFPVLVENTCNGSVRLVDCAFWGPNRQCVVSHSRSFVSLSDCYLSSTGRAKNLGVALVEADGGRLQVRGCSFGTDEPGIALMAPAIINSLTRAASARRQLGRRTGSGFPSGSLTRPIGETRNEWPRSMPGSPRINVPFGSSAPMGPRPM